MKKIAGQLPYLLRNVISVVGLSLIVLSSSAQAQPASQTSPASKTPQIKQKAASTSAKQAGIQLKDNSLNRSSKSMNLNPELFKMGNNPIKSGRLPKETPKGLLDGIYLKISDIIIKCINRWGACPISTCKYSN